MKVEKFQEQRLFSLESGSNIPDLWEEEDLERRSDFQARAPVAGADFKEMALDYLIRAGARILWSERGSVIAQSMRSLRLRPDVECSSCLAVSPMTRGRPDCGVKTQC